MKRALIILGISALLLLLLIGVVLINSRKLPSITGLNQSSPSISSDGRRLTLDIFRGMHSSIYIFNLDNHQLLRLTDKTRFAFRPMFSPDDEWIVFMIAGEKFTELARIRPSGKDLTSIAVSSSLQWPVAFSHDGMLLYFVRENWNGRLALPLLEIWSIPLLQSGANPSYVGVGTSISSNGFVRTVPISMPNAMHRTIVVLDDSRSLSNSVGSGFGPSISPCGNYVAFTRVGSNWIHQVWLRHVLGGSSRMIHSSEWPISSPIFSAEGNKLLFRSRRRNSADVDEVVVFDIIDRSKQEFTIDE